MKKTSVLIGAVILLAAIATQAQLQPNQPPPVVKLRWDASPDAGVVSYNVYYGTAPRTYDTVVPVPDGVLNTTITLPKTTRGVRLYFACTAVRLDGLESDFSNELPWTAEALPAPPVLYLSTVEAKQLSGTGEAYQTYELQRSLDLQLWACIGQVEADVVGQFSTVDPTPPREFAFYRLAQSVQ